MLTSFKRFCLVAGVATLAGLAHASVASAGEVTADQIIKALSPQPLTRSLSTRPAAPTAAQAADVEFINSLRGKATRSLTVSDRSKLETVAADKPKIDLVMEFGYNSASVAGQAAAIAEQLGSALTSANLNGSTILLSGHTDAKGSEAANQRLSERRAEAVKAYLVSHYSIKPENVIAAGYGKSQLKNPNDPFSGENRRVQAVNVLPVTSAQK